MLNLKKTLQKYFKLTGYFLFKVLYGRIVGTVNAESESGIKVDLIKKNDNTNDKTNKNKRDEIKGEKIVCNQTFKNLSVSF